MSGEYQVAVTDGFTGNNMLKLMEGTISMMFDIVRSSAEGSLRGRLGGALLLPTLRDARTRLDYRRYGAVPMLGVNGEVFIGHGRSDAEAIANAVRSAGEAKRHGVLDEVRAAIAARYRPVDDEPEVADEVASGG